MNVNKNERNDLSVDDLLRIQEEPRRKRRRLKKSPSVSQNSAEKSDHSSASEESTSPADEKQVDSDDGLGEPDGHEGPQDQQFMSRVMNLGGKREGMRTPSRSVSFASLGVLPSLQGALSSMSILKPTDIQSACLPPLLAGRDCIANAKTGSGKTIAFAIPILQRLAADPYGIFALILTPTRELAFQISEQFAVLGSSLNVRTAIVVGGMDMMSQAQELRSRPHVVIATPGRMVDLLRSGSGEWDLSRVKFLVLDEADRLLTPSFAPELAHLFGVMPKERQTCLFTATLTPAIDALAEAPPRPGKERPFIHRINNTVETVATLKQYYLLVPSHIREPYLFHLLCNPPESTVHLRRAPSGATTRFSRTGKSKRSKPQSASKDDEGEMVQPPPTIIFCTKPRTAAYLTNLLQTLSIRSTALHSRLTQRERLSSLSLFRSSVIPVLISTDVGSRGLDIEDVALVINWDLPDEPEEYTHRVGRTARAGKGGVAISFATERDEERLLRIEERIKTKLVEMVLPEGKVLEKLNQVSTAKRVSNMELHDSGFGEREERRRRKLGKIVRQDPR